MGDSRTARNLNDINSRLYQSIKSNQVLNKRIDALQQERRILNDQVNRSCADADADADPLKTDLSKLGRVRDAILVRQGMMIQQIDRLKDLIDGVKKDTDQFHRHVENLQASQLLLHRSIHIKLGISKSIHLDLIKLKLLC